MKEVGTYVCVSPFGDTNHAMMLAMTTTTRPMMMLQLLHVSFLHSCTATSRNEILDSKVVLQHTRLPF